MPPPEALPLDSAKGLRPSRHPFRDGVERTFRLCARADSPSQSPQRTERACRDKSQETWMRTRRGQGGDRKAPLSRPQARNPCLRKRATMSERHAIRSRPSDATICKEWIKQLGGAPAGAQSYWQRRFAACTFVGGFLGVGRTRNSWGVAPNPTRGAAP